MFKTNPNLWLYVLHAAFWAAFGLTRWWASRQSAAAPATPVVARAQEAPHSRALMGFHMLGFGLMYFALGAAIIPRHVPHVFTGQRSVAAVLIVVGALFACWALLYFRSWRFRAQLDPGHQLATGGPFHYVRHPIYLGLSLLAIGSAVWVPTLLMAVAVLCMLLAADWRARAEENLLTAGFGEAYTSYCSQTRRFVPGRY